MRRVLVILSLLAFADVELAFGVNGLQMIGFSGESTALGGSGHVAIQCTPDQTLSLADFRGQPVVLAFYPADWSPVCGDQMALYNEVLPEFRRHNAAIMGISVDSAWCHNAFAAHRRLHFPLLADFEPKGAVARTYGAYRTKEGVAERALFVLDGQGTIRWSYLSPIGVNPGADGILASLESMAPASRSA